MSPDLKLVAKQAADGDRAAFRTIVVHTQDRLYRLAARIMGNTADAEDVLQEAYVRAHRALTEGRFESRANVSTWLHRIVTNGAVDALRARDRRKEDAAAEERDSSAPRVARFDQHVTQDVKLALRELGEWLDALPPQQRAAIVLKAIEGHTTAEVAEILELTPGAVEQLLVRARATLRLRRASGE